MIAHILGTIIAISPIPGGDPAARLEVEVKPCTQVRKLLPQVRCVTDKRMLTMHIRSRTDFDDPVIQKVIASEMLAWFGSGGGTFVLHMRVQDEFLVCMTRPGGFTCWNAERVTAEGVDTEGEVLQDAPITEVQP